MNKAKEYASELRQKWLEESSVKQYPELIVESFDQEKKDGYQSKYRAGAIHIKANNPYSAVFGLSQIFIGVASGHLADFLGDIKPRFFLRPLWPQSDEFIESDKVDQFCKRATELGFNAVVFEEAPMKSVYNTLHGFGLKVILRAKPLNMSCPVDPKFKNEIKKQLSDSECFYDFLFWESHVSKDDFLNHPDAYDETIRDLVFKELKLVEETLSSSVSLIFYIPCENEEQAKLQSKWMESFCDDMGDKTILSFSAVSGKPDQDHLSPHPFWEVLRKSPDVSATPLLPILNIGAINHGEGMWPLLTTDLIDQYVTKLKRHNFAGVMSMIKTLPKRQALLDCSLWTLSQSLWGMMSTQAAIETWFRARKPEFCYHRISQLLKQVRLLAMDVSNKKNILDQLPKLSSEEFSDYVTCFTHDVKQRLKGDQNQMTFAKEGHYEKSLIAVRDDNNLFEKNPNQSKTDSDPCMVG